MTDFIAIQPSGAVKGSIRPPGSKSITNRALICAALAEGTTTLSGVLDSEDTRVMVEALTKLGISVSADWANATIVVEGCNGKIPGSSADLYIANSGTSVRFLVSMLTLANGRFRLDGTKRMRERPIQDLLNAIQQVGTSGISVDHTGCPPVVIESNGWQGNQLSVRGDVSSQFLSGLLMAAPAARIPNASTSDAIGGVKINVEGTLVSIPYVTMTLEVMKQFGVTVEVETNENNVPQTFHIPQQSYLRIADQGADQGPDQENSYSVEPDASAASYFFAAAAITQGTITVEGLSRDSLQGDVEFVDALEQMGCEVKWEPNSITVTGKPLRGIEIDMNGISDTVMTLAVVALFAEGPTKITGVAHIRHKETDRLQAMATELSKVGSNVREFADGLEIHPAKLHGARLDTYDDHRLAMSLALIGLLIPGIEINDPKCTGKTYPNFFEDLQTITS